MGHSLQPPVARRLLLAHKLGTGTETLSGEQPSPWSSLPLTSHPALSVSQLRGTQVVRQQGTPSWLASPPPEDTDLGVRTENYFPVSPMTPDMIRWVGRGFGSCAWQGCVRCYRDADGAKKKCWPTAFPSQGGP
jgi:hypothetical protein